MSTHDAYADIWVGLYENGAFDTDNWEGSDCMAGRTRVRTPTGLVRVDELEVGMQVMGVVTTEGEQKSDCAVVGIGINGYGPVVGNYTPGHFILNDDDNMVVEYGTTTNAIGQELRNDTLFDVLLDCPFGVDESGIKYSAMANFHSMETHEPVVTFNDHLVVYDVLLGLVRETGSFWLFSNSYDDITDAKIRRGHLVDLMMECLHSGEEAPVCDEMESTAAEFVEVQFPSTGGRRALMGDNSAGHYADLIHTALPKLGEAGGGSGTAVFALRQEVAKRDHTISAVISTLATVAGIAIVAFVTVVCKRRIKNKKSVAAGLATPDLD